MYFLKTERPPYSSTLPPNIIGSSCLNTHKQQSPANIRKPSHSAPKLSHLEARKSAHQKLNHDRGVDTNNLSANHFYFYSYF